jgi:hypothetical protein
MIQDTPSTSNLVAFDSYLRALNKTRVTGFRWREKGLISTVNIFGRLYVTREAIAAFEKRALAGEFSQKAKTPKRTPEAAR